MQSKLNSTTPQTKQAFQKVQEDYDSKYQQQAAEMQQIRQTVYDLELAHGVGP